MLRVVIAALLPLTGIAVWQASIALEDSHDLVSARLRANAWGIAEQQRDPFIIAQHSLVFAAEQPGVRAVGARCSSTLASGLLGAGGIINFVRADAQGKVRCSALPFTPGQDLSRDAWWLQRAGRRSLYLAAPQIGSISGHALHIMVLPLYSAVGEFEGTLSAGIGIDALTASLREQDRSRPGTILVTDGTGKPIAISGQPIFDRLSQITGAQTSPRAAIARDGQEWTYVSAPLFRDQLFVVYAEPAPLVTQMALARMWPSLLLPLLAVLFTSIAIWIASHRLILRWLEHLREITARFARGDFRGEMDRFADAPVEFTQFSADLHQMAQSIHAQETSLRTALAVQSALTKEVHHRVKNNLQIITSLLSLQSDRLTDPLAQAALQQARTRIGALGLIHRLLYEGEGEDEQGFVDMQRLAHDLCAQLRASHRRRADVTLECHADSISLSADQAVPLTLFIVEAVNNAFLHGFGTTGPGRITVEVTTADGKRRVCVRDNGSGFAIDTTAPSMGIDLIHAFGEQAGGKVVIVSDPSGTTLTLEFPASD